MNAWSVFTSFGKNLFSIGYPDHLGDSDTLEPPPRPPARPRPPLEASVCARHMYLIAVCKKQCREYILCHLLPIFLASSLQTTATAELQRRTVMEW